MSAQGSKRGRGDRSSPTPPPRIAATTKRTAAAAAAAAEAAAAHAADGSGEEALEEARTNGRDRTEGSEEEARPARTARRGVRMGSAAAAAAVLMSGSHGHSSGGRGSGGGTRPKCAPHAMHGRSSQRRACSGGAASISLGCAGPRHCHSD